MHTWHKHIHTCRHVCTHKHTRYCRIFPLLTQPALTFVLQEREHCISIIVCAYGKCFTCICIKGFLDAVKSMPSCMTSWDLDYTLNIPLTVLHVIININRCLSLLTITIPGQHDKVSMWKMTFHFSLFVMAWLCLVWNDKLQTMAFGLWLKIRQWKSYHLLTCMCIFCQGYKVLPSKVGEVKHDGCFRHRKWLCLMLGWVRYKQEMCLYLSHVSLSVYHSLFFSFWSFLTHSLYSFCFTLSHLISSEHSMIYLSPTSLSLSLHLLVCPNASYPGWEWVSEMCVRACVRASGAHAHRVCTYMCVRVSVNTKHCPGLDPHPAWPGSGPVRPWSPHSHH